MLCLACVLIVIVKGQKEREAKAEEDLFPDERDMIRISCCSADNIPVELV